MSIDDKLDDIIASLEQNAREHGTMIEHLRHINGYGQDHEKRLRIVEKVVYGGVAITSFISVAAGVLWLLR